jgi:hypothetical protein
LGRRVDRDPGGLRATTVALSQSAPECTPELSRALFAAHDRIFAGLDEHAFVRYLCRSGALATKIRIYRDALGAIVGYAAIHRFRTVVPGGSVTVFRAEAGLLLEHRGKGRTFEFYVGELVKQRLRHPLEPTFYLGMLVHPSSYLGLVRYFRDIYPRRDAGIPQDARCGMLALADAFGVPPVDPSDPFIRRVGWITRESEPFWERTQDPDVVFYRERNPGYRQGHGLLVLVPVTMGNLVHALWSYARRRPRRRGTAAPP